MAEKLPVPVFDSLAEIYPSQAAVLREGERWNKIVTEFERRYGSRPAFLIRAPGRVNILGEHIDYSLFPVLPAAIEQDIIVALRPTSEPSVRLTNILPSYEQTSFPLKPPDAAGAEWHVDFISPKDGGGWDNYVKVAIAEGLEEFFKGGKGKDGKAPRGMDLLISGTVPAGAGLSSSAAFVVASVITFLVANELMEGFTKGDVVRMAMASEHRMGLRTGGMDQAASALCLSNSLLHLSFYPTLSPKPLPLPSSLAVVITNSLAVHELANSAPEQYNLRVVESLCAARLLLHAWGMDDHPHIAGKSGEAGRMWLKEALAHWSEEGDEVKVHERAISHLKESLGQDGRDVRGWTREEMIAASGMGEEDFTKTYLDFLEIRATHFHLYSRALHALTESLRVSRFAQICRDFSSASSPSEPEEVPDSDPRLAELGALLNASHESCRDLYDCTHELTDELQELCLKNGALGARQTGGGWGGAVISLVPTSQAEGFLQRMKRDYAPYRNLSEEQVGEAAFATLPGSGAGVYVVNGHISA